MANAKLGSRASYGGTFVQTLDTDGTQLSPGDSGKVFMCKQTSSDRGVNLPPLASSAGWNAKFLLHTESSGDFKILAWGLPHAGATGDGGVTNDGDKVNFIRVADAGTRSYNQDGVEFVASQANKGDWIDIFCDGSNWYAFCFSSDDAHIVAIDS